MRNGHQLASALRRTYLVWQSSADATLAAIGTTYNQYVLLQLIADLEPAGRSEILDASGAVTNRAALQLLERKRLVARSAGDDNCLLLSDCGREFLQLCNTRLEQLHRQMTLRLDSTQQEELQQGLDLVRDGLKSEYDNASAVRRRSAGDESW